MVATQSMYSSCVSLCCMSVEVYREQNHGTNSFDRERHKDGQTDRQTGGKR